VNSASIVNIKTSDGSALERDLANALRGILAGISWLRGSTVEAAGHGRPDWDLKASWPVAGGTRAVLCVECKLNFQPSQFALLANQPPCGSGRHETSARVLAMPRVSPRMAALCQQNGWSWFDLAGNCRLDVPGVLLIERSGNEAVRPANERASANLSSPEAGRVVRALLAPENAGRRWTQRAMVAHFAELTPPIPAPSLALVNKVIQHLREQAFVEPLPDRGFALRDSEGLLREWSAAYRFDRHSRQRYFTLLHGRTLQDKLRALDPHASGRLAFAAFSAADVQAANVRQPRTWLYVAPGAMREFEAAIEAKPVDSGENLVVLVPEDRAVFYRLEAHKSRLACTNPVQTYVDLIHVGGRGAEAAEALLEQRLKPAWAAVAR
jgi:hypothetical protein